MKPVTEMFVFHVLPGNRKRTLEILKGLQAEIIEAAQGSVKSVRTLIGNDDDTLVSQIYEWDDILISQKVNALFPKFENAAKLQKLNDKNVVMGLFTEHQTNRYIED